MPFTLLMLLSKGYILWVENSKNEGNQSLLPISGSSWYCRSLSESLKQRVKELTWLAFSWSTDLASIAWKRGDNVNWKIFMKKVWLLTSVLIAVTVAIYLKKFLLLLAKGMVKFIAFSNYHFLFREKGKIEFQNRGKLTCDRNLLTLFEGWCGREFPFLFLRNLNLSFILN